jgi:sec-independent protein translocase protein TatC
MPEREGEGPSLLAMLEELRWRLVWFAAFLFVAFLISLWFSGEIFAWLALPLVGGLEKGEGLIGTGLMEALLIRLKVSLTAALFASSPVFFYHAWRIASPVLGIQQKVSALPFVLSASFFFSAGGLFCHQLVFPVAFSYLIGQYRTIATSPEIRAAEYFAFSFRMMIGFGLTFELPVVSFFLARLRLITHSQLWKHSRIAAIAIFILAAVLTPGPDVLSQLLLAGPLCVLYGISIVVAYLAHPKG